MKPEGCPKRCLQVLAGGDLSTARFNSQGEAKRSAQGDKAAQFKQTTTILNDLYLPGEMPLFGVTRRPEAPSSS
jgi:hypothetical protein